MVKQDPENENSPPFRESGMRSQGRYVRWPKIAVEVCIDILLIYKLPPKESSGSWSWTLEMSPSERRNINGH